MLGVDGEGFLVGIQSRAEAILSAHCPHAVSHLALAATHLAEHILAVLEAEQDVLVVEGIGRSNVDDVHVGVLDELLVAAVGLGLGRAASLLDEVLCLGDRGRGGHGDDLVVDVGGVALSRVRENVLGELLGDTEGAQYEYKEMLGVSETLPACASSEPTPPSRLSSGADYSPAAGKETPFADERRRHGGCGW